MLEKQIEKRVCDHARQKNVLVYKFSSPGHAAVPDRMFILPTGGMFFIEFKRSGEHPTIPQEREHNKLRGHGVTVYVVDDVQYGKAIIDCHLSGLL